MTKHSSKKLELSIETLQLLTSSELDEVVGGRPPDTSVQTVRHCATGHICETR